MSHNQFQFIGNLTRDVEVKHSDSGNSRAIFDLAVNRVWRNASGEKQEQADFFRIKAFNVLAENAGKYLGKGSKVFVQGRIEPTKFEKDGKTEYSIDFIAEGIEYLDTKPPKGK
ncbi:single-stranded DNA-binding protein [Neisseriaceae bacterium ESL0693]|nr:single-stranded DNA-binding protein [Neisseriaceae bacterium ESL0693]